MVCLKGLQVVASSALLLLLSPILVNARYSSRDADNYPLSRSESDGMLGAREKLLLRRELSDIIEELNARRLSKVEPHNIYSDIYERSRDELNARRSDPLLSAKYDELATRDQGPTLQLPGGSKRKSWTFRRLTSGNNLHNSYSQSAAEVDSHQPNQAPGPAPASNSVGGVVKKIISLASINKKFQSPLAQQPPVNADSLDPEPIQTNGEDHGKPRKSPGRAERFKNGSKKVVAQIKTTAKGAKKCMRDAYNRLVCTRPDVSESEVQSYDGSATSVPRPRRPLTKAPTGESDNTVNSFTQPMERFKPPFQDMVWKFHIPANSNHDSGGTRTPSMLSIEEYDAHFNHGE